MKLIFKALFCVLYFVLSLPIALFYIFLSAWEYDSKVFDIYVNHIDQTFNKIFNLNISSTT